MGLAPTPQVQVRDTKPPFGAKFDPMTGQPIPKFDPHTGQQNWSDPVTPEDVTVRFGDGALGLDLGENDEKLGGVVVGAVRAGGQGEAGGVVPRSVIVGLNGEDVHTWSRIALVERLAKAPRPLALKLKTPVVAKAKKTKAIERLPHGLPWLTAAIEQGKPLQFTLAGGRMLYVDATGTGYAHPWACYIPLFSTTKVNYSIWRRRWYPDKDGVLTDGKGRQLFTTPGSGVSGGWVHVEKPGKGENTDPARRIRASDLQPDGTILLADGRQLYANKSKWRLVTQKQDTHTNNDPKRRVWTVREAPEISTAEAVGREAAFWLLGVPLMAVCCVLGCLCSGDGGGGGGYDGGSSSWSSGSDSYNGSGDGGDGGDGG